MKIIKPSITYKVNKKPFRQLNYLRHGKIKYNDQILIKISSYYF